MTGEYFYNTIVDASRSEENKDDGPYMTEAEIATANQDAKPED